MKIGFSSKIFSAAAWLSALVLFWLTMLRMIPVDAGTWRALWVLFFVAVISSAAEAGREQQRRKMIESKDVVVIHKEKIYRVEDGNLLLVPFPNGKFYVYLEHAKAEDKQGDGTERPRSQQRRHQVTITGDKNHK